MQDFRSKDGLYNIIPEQTPTPISSGPSTPSKSHLPSEDYFSSSQASAASTTGCRSSSSPYPKLKGQDLFDASVWKTPYTAELFYRFIASLRQKIRDEVNETAQTHKFIRTLRDGGRLMRCYTQNIDGLERREGLSMDLSRGKGTKRRFMKKTWGAPRPTEPQNSDADGGCEVVPLHGDLEVLRCTLCQGTFPWSDEATADFTNGIAPECSKCTVKSWNRQEKGKRGVAVGSLRPNIVLYGEEHPSNQALAPLVPFDLSSGPEILIVMGTSLKVHGLQKVVREFARKIHARKDGKGKVLLVNKTKPAESVWGNVIDSYIEMDCDDWVKDLRRRREDLWLRQGELNLKTTKPTASKRKSTDDSSTSSKRTKVVVEIPTKRRTTGATPWIDEVIEARPNSSLMTPPPSRGKAAAERSLRAPTAEPLIPQTSDNIAFQRQMYDDPFRCVFGSPARPEPSPLRNTWKPSIRDTNGGASPERPQIFSPIEGRRTKLRVYQDPDLEGGESHDKEAEDNASMLETPSKIRVLRPSLDSRLNSTTLKEWSAEDGKGVPPPGDEKLGPLSVRPGRLSVTRL
jgi:NAD-dependent SIR2 family protein deacetylase